MEVNTGLSQNQRSMISEGLAKILADTYALYLKTQNFHWNIQGAEFFALHLLFEKQYEEMAEATDEIAERIRALGLYVDATFTSFARETHLKETHKLLTAKDMLKDLLEGHEVLIRRTRQILDHAEQDKDGATVDLLGRRLGAHEKMAWMLRSHL